PAVLYSIVSFVLRPAPTATLFPYTTLFRSAERGRRAILARQLDQRVAPHRLAERESRALTEQPAVQARRDHDQRLLAQPAREGAQVLRPHPAHAQPPVAAVAKELGMGPPQLEALPGEQELPASVLEMLGRRARGDAAGAHFREQGAPATVVDRAAVVGIDQRKLPDLVPLVDIGHAGRGQLEKRLRQAVEQPEAPHPALEID